MSLECWDVYSKSGETLLGEIGPSEGDRYNFLIHKSIDAGEWNNLVAQVHVLGNIGLSGEYGVVQDIDHRKAYILLTSAGYMLRDKEMSGDNDLRGIKMSEPIKTVYGIDLGTTFSAIASLDDLGNPEVLASIEDNRKITASAIYINGNNVTVGDKALNHIKEEPKKVVLQTKREMENDVVYSVDHGKWTDDKDLVDAYTPAQVSSLILKKLKDYTTDVKKAVITVPAMFAEKARQATLDAAKLADLEVIELINEPTAAVLHYASLPGVEVGGRVMIFDLGGGTFDVTFAEVKNKKVDVLTSRGDKYLGGRDFDKEITKLMKKKYHSIHNVDIDIENKKEYLQKAEEVKKILSVKNKASISIDGPKGPQQIEITLEEFEESIQTYIEKIKMLIEEAMEASGTVSYTHLTLPTKA